MTKVNRTAAVKTGLLVTVLVATNVVFGLACARAYRQYQGFFSPGPELLKVAVWVLGSIALVIAAAGLLVALVRPFRMIIVAFVLSALALVFVLETSRVVSGALGLGYAVLAILSARSVIGELNGRLRFSVSAIKQGQGLLVQALILLVCISFGLGYREDAVAGGFIIPPSLQQTIRQTVLPRVEEQIEAHIEATSSARGTALAREKAGALEAARQQFDRTFADVERSLEAYARYIWVGVALMALSMLNFSQVLLSWVPTVVLSGALLLLKTLGAARVVTETAETRRLVLS